MGDATIKLIKLSNIDSFYKGGILEVTHNTSLLSKAKGKRNLKNCAKT